MMTEQDWGEKIYENANELSELCNWTKKDEQTAHPFFVNFYPIFPHYELIRWFIWEHQQHSNDEKPFISKSSVNHHDSQILI